MTAHQVRQTTCTSSSLPHSHHFIASNPEGFCISVQHEESKRITGKTQQCAIKHFIWDLLTNTISMENVRIYERSEIKRVQELLHSRDKLIFSNHT